MDRHRPWSGPRAALERPGGWPQRAAVPRAGRTRVRPTDRRARWALRRRAELRSGEDRPDRGRAGPDGQDFEDAEDCRARQQQGSVAPETGSSSSHTRVHEGASSRERGAEETSGLVGARWRRRSRDASEDGEWEWECAQRVAAKNATTKTWLAAFVVGGF
eukprot:scaffold12930_cov69-Phaeocystis_antarctica.AAC.3